MRLDELEKVDPKVMMDAIRTVLDSMETIEPDSDLPAMRLPEGAVDSMTGALCAKFLQMFCTMRGAPPCQVFADHEMFKQHEMALQTIIVVAYTVGHTCGEAAPNVSGVVH